MLAVSVITWLGKNMKQFVFRLAFAIAAFLPASSVLAADLDIPPPVENLRPATYDWSGPYVGAFVGGIAETGTYDVVCAPLACGATGLREMNGVGWNGGILAGWNYQMDSFVMGIEGDWAFGGHVAQNHEPAELTDFNFDNIASLSARFGWALDDTLLYAKGGVALVDSTFSTTALGGGSAEDSKWLVGWIIGGGMEHAFSDRISGRLEYAYMSLPDTDYSLVNGAASADVSHSFDGVHSIRAGLSYNFGW
jgi:outer membrane immunogenic protein